MYCCCCCYPFLHVWAQNERCLAYQCGLSMNFTRSSLKLFSSLDDDDGGSGDGESVTSHRAGGCRLLTWYWQIHGCPSLGYGLNKTFAIEWTLKLQKEKEQKKKRKHTH